MSTFLVDQVRRIVPRWRFTDNISNSTEFASYPRKKHSRVLNKKFLEQKLVEWRKSPNFGNAIDLVNCGVGGGWLDEVKPAAEFLKQYDDTSSTQTTRLIQHVLQSTSTISGIQLNNQQFHPSTENLVQAVRIKISTTRKKLQRDYRNPLLWLDIALAYSILGQKNQALSSVDHALYLEPEHRHILRSAVRLYIHIGDVERAHSLLHRNPKTKFDPWLIATELAVATVAGRSPKFTRHGKRIIDSGNLPPEYLTELHSAIGTLDFNNGIFRRARQNFRASMIKPTDNTVAQARWIRKYIPDIEITNEAFGLPLGFEARCWRELERGRWEAAQKECLNWLNDEPFSSRPAMVASYIGLTLTTDFITAKTCAEVGIQADPDNFTLLNNLTVALAYCGEIERALKTFAKITSMKDGDLPQYVYIATLGLLRFRVGDIQGGRQCYKQAETMAPNSQKIRAKFFWVREELNAKTTDATTHLESFLNYKFDTNDSQMTRLSEQLQNQLSYPLPHNRVEVEEILRCRQQLTRLTESGLCDLR